VPEALNVVRFTDTEKEVLSAAAKVSGLDAAYKEAKDRIKASLSVIDHAVRHEPDLTGSRLAEVKQAIATVDEFVTTMGDGPVVTEYRQALAKAAAIVDEGAVLAANA
jgi:hypothetical protein